MQQSASTPAACHFTFLYYHRLSLLCESQHESQPSCAAFLTLDRQQFSLSVKSCYVSKMMAATQSYVPPASHSYAADSTDSWRRLCCSLLLLKHCGCSHADQMCNAGRNGMVARAPNQGAGGTHADYGCYCTAWLQKVCQKRQEEPSG